MFADDLTAVSIVLGLLVLIYVVPPAWVVVSGRSHGGAKFGWFLIAVFFSWLGLAAFLIVTQAAKDGSWDDD